jgi:hypothetical protein
MNATRTTQTMRFMHHLECRMSNIEGRMSGITLPR